MINDYDDDGAKMLDAISFNQALKLTWIIKYSDHTNHWLDKLGRKKAFLCNLSKGGLRKLKINDRFLNEILEMWSEIQFQHTLESFDEFSEQTLWNNSLIRIENNPILSKGWKQKGVPKVSHVFEKTSTPRFISHEELQKNYDIETYYLQYYGLISSLNQLRKEINSNQNCRQTENKTLINNVLAGLASAKTFYLIFIEQLRIKPTTNQTKWENECELDSLEKMNWKTFYSKSFKCS